MSNTKKPSGFKTVFLLILLLLGGLALFFFLQLNKGADKTPPISMEQEQRKWQDKVNVFEKENAPSNDHSAQESTEAPSDRLPLADVTSTAPGAAQPQTTDPCQEATNRIDQFFTHLDEQDYITDLQLDKGAKTFFTRISDTLLQTQPKITRETDDLLSILHNAAHFYKVLGDKDVFILKKIMAHEKAYYEPVLADFYYLLKHENDCRHIDSSIKLPLKELYGYSVFFLNTLGGQAYLFRRDITLRTLIKYYCILVLDLANENNVNHLGLDARYPINSLIDEMSAVSGIDGKEKYLANLRLLKEKYEKAYGAL